MYLPTCIVYPEPLVSHAPYQQGLPDPDADGDSVMDIGQRKGNPGQFLHSIPPFLMNCPLKQKGTMEQLLDWGH